MAVAAFLQKSQDSVIPGHWILLGVSMFITFATTGALKEGRVFGRFYDCSKRKAPVSFWLQIAFGYLLAGMAAGLFAYIIVK